MPGVERYGGFWTRRRAWQWVVAGIALTVIGHLLDSIPVVAGLQHVTEWVAANLRAVQPFAIADLFFDATRGHRGLWFCEPVGDTLGCGSVFGLANVGIASLFAAPRVAKTLWHEGGVISLALFGLTLLGMAAIILSGWRDAIKENGSLGTALITTVGVLALGPLAAGALFWLLLQFLLLLTWLIGVALAGVAWCIATFGAAYKGFALVFESIKKGDELQKSAALLTGKPPPPEA